MFVARDRWFVVLASAELTDRPVGAKRLGHPLVFWRAKDGSPRAAVDRCPHRQVKLSGGTACAGVLACPFHGFEFDENGVCISVPAHPDRRVPAALSLELVPVVEAHGFVWLWTGPSAVPDTPPPFFAELLQPGWTWAGSERAVDVACHHTRAVENQLDYAHLVFVHARTIGRFAQTVSDDIQTQCSGDLLSVTMPGGGVIELLGGAIWRLETGSQWQFLAFVPVDEGQMRYYTRTYQRARLGWLDAVMLWVGAEVNVRVILPEDTAVVETHAPGETRLRRTGEVLVPSDGPIVAYRRWRESLRAEWRPVGGCRVAADDGGVEA